jgi:hypothetical protein
VRHQSNERRSANLVPDLLRNQGAEEAGSAGQPVAARRRGLREAEAPHRPASPRDLLEVGVDLAGEGLARDAGAVRPAQAIRPHRVARRRHDEEERAHRRHGVDEQTLVLDEELPDRPRLPYVGQVEAVPRDGPALAEHLLLLPAGRVHPVAQLPRPPLALLSGQVRSDRRHAQGVPEPGDLAIARGELPGDRVDLGQEVLVGVGGRGAADLLERVEAAAIQEVEETSRARLLQVAQRLVRSIESQQRAHHALVGSGALQLGEVPPAISLGEPVRLESPILDPPDRLLEQGDGSLRLVQHGESEEPELTGRVDRISRGGAADLDRPLERRPGLLHLTELPEAGPTLALGALHQPPGGGREPRRQLERPPEMGQGLPMPREAREALGHDEVAPAEVDASGHEVGLPLLSALQHAQRPLEAPERLGRSSGAQEASPETHPRAAQVLALGSEQALPHGERLLEKGDRVLRAPQSIEHVGGLVDAPGEIGGVPPEEPASHRQRSPAPVEGLGEVTGVGQPRGEAVHGRGQARVVPLDQALAHRDLPTMHHDGIAMAPGVVERARQPRQQVRPVDGVLPLLEPAEHGERFLEERDRLVRAGERAEANQTHALPEESVAQLATVAGVQRPPRGDRLSPGAYGLVATAEVDQGLRDPLLASRDLGVGAVVDSPERVEGLPEALERLLSLPRPVERHALGPEPIGPRSWRLRLGSVERDGPQGQRHEERHVPSIVCPAMPFFPGIRDGGSSSTREWADCRDSYPLRARRGATLAALRSSRGAVGSGHRSTRGNPTLTRRKAR